MFRRTACTGLLVTTTAMAEPAVASDGFERVEERDQFVELVDGKDLSILRPFFLRAAIELQVLPEGDISGEAMRKPVEGAWQWQDGYFCRDLKYGTRDLGPNCQEVRVRGDEIRFIADRGEGDKADFRLK